MAGWIKHLLTLIWSYMGLKLLLFLPLNFGTVCLLESIHVIIN